MVANDINIIIIKNLKIFFVLKPLLQFILIVKNIAESKKEMQNKMIKISIFFSNKIIPTIWVIKTIRFEKV
jgi:hypothetical protein